MYWSTDAPRILSSISPTSPLAPQLAGAYSRTTIPNWQDSSTTPECRALDEAFGGSAGLAHATGSKAHERFTGAQIMRFRRLFSDDYARTDRISLVSSAITTLLCLDGEVKGIDESDACGMNMWCMSTERRGWNRTALEVIAGDQAGGGGAEELERKLGKVESDGGRVVGNIGQWFVKRYGFHPDCCVFPGTGDNPATFLSLTRESYERSPLFNPIILKSVSCLKAIAVPHVPLSPSSHPQFVPPKASSLSAHPTLCSYRPNRTILIRNITHFSTRLKSPRQVNRTHR